MYKIVVCDDDKENCKYVKSMIEMHFSGNCEIATISEPVEIATFFGKKENYVDIMFMDINLEKLNGIDLIKEYQTENKLTKIVYISAYSSYMKNTFDTIVTDFIEKPISNSDIKKSLDKIVNNGHHKQETYVYLKSGSEMVKINPNNIIFIESKQRKINVHLCTGKVKELYCKLDDAHKRLPYYFLRTHKSFLVNFNYITKKHKTKLFLDNQKQINISRAYRDEFEENFNKLIGDDII